MKRLFEVRAEIVAYVMAEDDEDAYDVGRRALKDETEWNDVDVCDRAEVKTRGWYLDGGWSRDALVHNGDGATLGEVLDTLPEVKP